MADVNNIKLSPEQMEAKAAEFNTRCEEFNQVVSTMRNVMNGPVTAARHFMTSSNL